MSEGVKVQGIGIHEFLRYAIPGYSFLLVFYLPFVLTETLALRFPNWEQFIPFFLVAGLMIGYSIYYPYYWYYRNCINTLGDRKSLELAMKLLEEKSVTMRVRAVHDIALSKETGEIKARCNFLFSVFHSIGAMLFSVWSGFGCSLIWVIWKLPLWGSWLLIVEAIVALVLVVLSLFLASEYKFRYELAFRVEDWIIGEHVEEIVERERAHTRMLLERQSPNHSSETEKKE